MSHKRLRLFMLSMRLSRLTLAPLLVGCVLLAFGSMASAQVSDGLNFGSEPSCPYGYFDYAPYNCAPHGYYGPEWFNGGRFIGAGRWYHGPENFHGRVDNHFDPNHGYRGETPRRGERGSYSGSNRFQGNASRDGRGHDYNNQGGRDSNTGGRQGGQGSFGDRGGQQGRQRGNGGHAGQGQYGNQGNRGGEGRYGNQGNRGGQNGSQGDHGTHGAHGDHGGQGNGGGGQGNGGGGQGNGGGGQATDNHQGH